MSVPFQQDVADRFIEWLRQQNMSEETVGVCERGLRCLDEFLDGRELNEATGAAYVRWMKRQRGWQKATVDRKIVVYDMFIRYLGKPEWAVSKEPADMEPKPAATKEEYAKLLVTAKATGNRTTYLFLRLLGCMGLRAQELLRITCEDVSVGYLTIERGSSLFERRLVFPDGLRSELQSYIQDNHIQSGYVFVAKTGNPILGQSLNDKLRRLAKLAGINENHSTGLALSRYYDTRVQAIKKELEPVAKKQFEKELADEQQQYGWSVGKVGGLCD